MPTRAGNAFLGRARRAEQMARSHWKAVQRANPALSFETREMTYSEDTGRYIAIPASWDRSRTWRLLDASGRPYASPTPGTFGGRRGRGRDGRIYGRLDCRAALLALARGGYARDRVFFADAAIAVAAGYRPCAVCMPSEYADWKALAPRAPNT